ncbi:MAG: type 2 lanthipeptide synthetase LanM [Eubacteriales bacterium]|nr:type 2 lanthipeptide synthetase LanM [Eubacteriales bacterium]
MDFWKDLLGETLAAEEISVLDSDLKMRADVCEIKGIFNSITQEEVEREKEELESIVGEATFGNFFDPFLLAAVEYGKRRSVVSFVKKNVFRQIYGMPLRTLVYEQHMEDVQGNLAGGDSKEKYQDFEARLGQIAYVRGLCEKYPEMFRLILLKCVEIVQYIGEILREFLEDKREIEGKLCEGVSFREIKNLELGLSDTHCAGKTTVKIDLDNGMSIIYKPHGLQKENSYQKAYAWLCKKADKETCDLPMLDKKSYGWERFLEKAACKNEREVERYFYRIGVHLFLCRLLGASDIHRENILAVGEFPVFLDAETIPGVEKSEEADSAEQKISRYAMDSVMPCGILPVFLWGQGEGVNLSVLSEEERQETPMKMPVIINDKTSDMKVVYQTKWLGAAESMPVLEGKKIRIADYTEMICKGFAEAYQNGMKDREGLMRPFREIDDLDTRYLFRHTQQYDMFLSSSFHPAFLTDTGKRKRFLQVLKKGESQAENPAVEYEIRELLNMDIPLFSLSKEEILKNSDGEEIGELEKKNRIAVWKRIEGLSEEDLRRQVGFIKATVEAYSHCPIEVKAKESQKGSREEAVRAELREIAELICRQAVWCGEDVNWLSIRFLGKRQWRWEPLEMSLYDGLSGITVFLALVKEVFPEEKYQKLFSAVEKKLLQYTDRVLAGGEEPKSAQTGAFLGESSIVYAYLLLREITGERKYLEYAKRHAVIVGRLMPQDTKRDFLVGNAGAIWVLCRLYRETGEECYREIAVKAGDALLSQAEEQETGIGWKAAGEKAPLAGMAHGNSGFLRAYAALLKETGNGKYVEVIRKVLEYEDSLYSEELENWRDVRKDTPGEYMNAWCNGAPGILVARMELRELEEFRKDEMVERDLVRAGNAVMGQEPGMQTCICHGAAGNYWIAREFVWRSGSGEWKERLGEIMDGLLGAAKEERVRFPEGRYMWGMMNGLAGVGVVLCGIVLGDKG